METWLIAVLAFVAVGGFWLISHLLHKKKVAAFTKFAAERGWRYAEKDRGLVGRYEGRPFNIGHSRSTKHVLRGAHRGREVVVFEYIYKETTGSGDDRKTEIYRNTVAAVSTPAPRPTLELSKEGLGRKLLGLVGVRDLQLESEEFNKAFHIQTENDKFAYDILHPRMMEWMLADHRARTIPFRFERADLLVWRPGEIELSRVDEMAGYVCDILDRTPSFVWKP